MKDAKESAQKVRKVLKAKYPKTKFSVCSKHFAGGSSVDVRWTDGPTEKEVEEATKHLKGYHNGYYNDYICTARHTSRAVMVAAAKAVSEFYGVPMPEVLGDEHFYLTDLTRVGDEALCDEVHRAVWKTNTYDKTPEEAFADWGACGALFR